MNVYLIRISDRPYGFTVRAIVAKTKEDAKEEARLRHRCYFGHERKLGHCHAEVVDICEALEGSSCFMVFQE
jgi:hypothetical protein